MSNYHLNTKLKNVKKNQKRITENAPPFRRFIDICTETLTVLELWSVFQNPQNIYGKLQFYSDKNPILNENVYGKSLINASCKKKTSEV